MTVAKGVAGGLPMGVLMASESVGKSLTPGTHASTFGGNPVAAAAGVAVLSVIVDDGLMDRMAPVAQRLRDGLESIAKRYPQVLEVRGRGLMLGMELSVPCAPIVEACTKRGVLINCTMDRVLRLIPPLVLTEEEAEEALGVLEEAFDEILGNQ
jgi:acetylornithine/succinyldiaminopimelate/putrescine aminotransferase